MMPLSRVVAYSAAKAAVINLTKLLAREWATQGIRVNAISPGFFPAEQNRAMLFNPDGSYTSPGGQIIGHTPMARFGQPEELAGAVVWLAARRASSFVTGQNIVVDGGFSATTIESRSRGLAALNRASAGVSCASIDAKLQLELRVLFGAGIQLFEQQARLDIAVVLVLVAGVFGDRPEISW